MYESWNLLWFSEVRTLENMSSETPVKEKSNKQLPTTVKVCDLGLFVPFYLENDCMYVKPTALMCKSQIESLAANVTVRQITSPDLGWGSSKVIQIFDGPQVFRFKPNLKSSKNIQFQFVHNFKKTVFGS